MNKEYNNLSIENLQKTEWFNLFDRYQKNEILMGLEDNLDVSVYAKPEFTEEQMQEIRIGLKDNLDVSIYAKIEFNFWQMDKIRLELLKESTL